MLEANPAVVDVLLVREREDVPQRLVFTGQTVQLSVEIPQVQYRVGRWLDCACLRSLEHRCGPHKILLLPVRGRAVSTGSQVVSRFRALFPGIQHVPRISVASVGVSLRW